VDKLAASPQLTRKNGEQRNDSQEKRARLTR
jgi:hypothetical protein